MKKITLLLVLLLCGVSGAVAQKSTDAYYQTHLTDLSAGLNSNAHDRYITKITLGSSSIGNSSESSSEAIGKTKKVYYSYLGWEQGLEAAQNATPALAIDMKGTWMHKYAYLDYGNDGTFDVSVNSDYSLNVRTDVASFNYYGYEEYATSPVERGVNSNGESANRNGADALPAVQMPSEAGFYRMRFKTDWNRVLPTGRPLDAASDKMEANGGQYVDVRLHVRGENSNIMVSAESSEIQTTAGEALPVAIPNGEPYTIKAVPTAGLSVADITVRYGYMLDNKDATPFLDDMVYWKETVITAAQFNENGEYTLPAEITKYDVRLTARCVTPAEYYAEQIVPYQTIAANAAAGTIGMQPLNVNQAKLNELNALLAKSFSELNLTSAAEVDAYISATLAPAAEYYTLVNPLPAGYYRFHNVNRGKNLGVRATDGRVMGVDADAKDLSQVWKWETSGSKFKLSAIGKHLSGMSSPNHQTGIAAAATMEDAGQEYFIRPVEDFSGQFRFAYSADANDCINMEDPNYNSGNSAYILDRWGGDNSRFTAEIVENITVDLTAIAGKTYATFCLPFDAELTTEGVTAYQGVMSDDNTVVNVTAVEGGIAAGEGVVLVGETAEATTATFNLSAPATLADFSANAFEGTYVNLASDGNIHVLNTGNQGVGFYKLDGTLAPYRAYLNVTAGGGAVKLAFGGNVTGIESIDNGQLTMDNDAPIYDLSGRRKVLAPAKGGIYVKGGKKIVF